MEKIKHFFIKLFNKNRELSEEEEQEILHKVIKKIKENTNELF